MARSSGRAALHRSRAVYCSVAVSRVVQGAWPKRRRGRKQESFAEQSEPRLHARFPNSENVASWFLSFQRLAPPPIGRQR